MTREFLKDVWVRDVLSVGTSLSNPAKLLVGTATPEGAETAPVGSLFLRTDGGALTSVYVKESGAGNTGWRRLVSLDSNNDLILPEDIHLANGKSLQAATGIADGRLVSGNAASGYAFYLERNVADGGAGLYINLQHASATGAHLIFQRQGATPVHLRSGAGTPEGSVTAPVGSIYLRSDGGTATTLYVKESGTGNTGWAAVGGSAPASGGRAFSFFMG